MGLRNWLKCLERGARKDLGSFELLDGTTYYFDRLEASKELFLHAYDLQLGRGEKWAEPPEVLEKLKHDSPQGAFVDPAALYDTDALVRDRRLVPIYVEPPEDLSE